MVDSIMPTVTSTGYPAGFGKATTSAPPPPADPTPFNPGHYVLLNINAATVTDHVVTGGFSSYTTVLSEISTKPVIKGLQFRFYWNQFENNTKGSFDWTALDTVLRDMADPVKVGTGGKRIMILIALTAGDGQAADAAWIVPAYMVPTGADKMAAGTDGVDYDGGQYGYSGIGSSGYRVRLANANVINRFNIFLTAMCNHIKDMAALPGKLKPFDMLENISFTESAQGSVSAGYTDPGTMPQFTNLVAAADAVQAALPNRLVSMMSNFPRSTASVPGIDYLIDQSELKKYALMTPDIFPDKADLWSAPNTSGFNEGVLHRMQSYTGARIPSVQEQDQRCTDFPTGGVCGATVPTFASNFDVVKNVLGAHYCIWQRATQDDPNIAGTQPLYQSMYNFLTTGDKTLNTTRPTNYPT